MNNIQKAGHSELENEDKELKYYCDRLNQENIKLQIQIKNMQDQIESFQLDSLNQTFMNNDTTNKQLLPGEFVQEWEILGKNDIQEHFLDFFDYPYICSNLIQEMFNIIINMVNNEILEKLSKILNILGITNDTNNVLYISKKLHFVFIDYYEEIFENDNLKDLLYTNFIDKYILFYKNAFGYYKNKDFFEIFTNKAFKLLVFKIRKMVLFTKFRQSHLDFNVQSFEKRVLTIQKSSIEKIIIVQGKLPKEKNEEVRCIHLIDPPLIKNYVSFYGLKPICLEINTNYNENQEKKQIQSYNDGMICVSKKRVSTENNEEDNIQNYTERELVPELTLENIKKKVVNYSPKINESKKVNSLGKEINIKKITEIKPTIKKRPSIKTKRDNVVQLIENQQKTNKEIKIIGAKLIKMCKIPTLNSAKRQNIIIDKLKVDTEYPIKSNRERFSKYQQKNKSIDNNLLSERLRTKTNNKSKIAVLTYQFGV